MPFAVAALLVGLALQPVQGQSPKGYGIAESKGAQTRNQAKPAQGGNEKPSIPPKAAPIRGSAQAKDNRQGADDSNEGIRIQWHLEIATWVLAFVGIITACVIGWQAWETRKTAEAARKSIELQQTQWLVLQNWRADSIETQRLVVSFDVVNPTNLPLTFQGSTFRVGQLEFNTRDGHLMAPHDPYTLSFPLTLDPTQWQAYCNSSYMFQIRGRLFFCARKQHHEQPFGGLVSCNQGGVTFSPHGAYEEAARLDAKENKAKRNE